MSLLPLVCVAALVISGCATAPMPLSEAVTVPPDRVFYTHPEGEKSATATFVRDGGFFGGGVSYSLLVDEEKVAIVRPGEKVTMKIPVGDLLVGVQAIDPLGMNTAPVTIEQRIEANKSYFYRVMTDTFGIRIQRTLGKGIN